MRRYIYEKWEPDISNYNVKNSTRRLICSTAVGAGY
jgi:hypothetical protein